MSSDNNSNGRNSGGRPSNSGYPGETPRRSFPGETPQRRNTPPPRQYTEEQPLNNGGFSNGRNSQQRRPSEGRPARRQPPRQPAGPSYDERYSQRGNPPPRPMKQKPKKSKFPIILLIIILIGLIGAGVFYLSYNNSLKPVDPSSTTIVAFDVAEGSTTASIADKLVQFDLIRNATFFKMRTKSTGYDGQFKPGSFGLSKAMSTDELIQALIQEGANFTAVQTFTIPEGLTLRQTMDSLVEDGLVTEEEFMNEVENGEFDYRFMEYLPAGENRLEGFLYPNTYEVFADATAHDIIDIMLAQFDANFTDDHYELAEKRKMNVLEIVTMASLIERETMVDEERPRVAGVIFNRIEEDMMLQIDATIQFLLPEVKESLLYSDLEVDSPYNTYKNYGLPPGPICSPRIESINAALNPEDHDYIFYVLAPELDGTHRFSRSASEFERNKELYYEALEKRG